MSEAYLEDLYYNLEKPTAFSNAQNIFRYARKEGRYNLSLNFIEKWLRKQEVYTRNRGHRSPLKRKNLYAPGPLYQFDADTAYMIEYHSANQPYKYFMLMIDVFSKVVRAKAMRSLQAASSAETVGALLDEGPLPLKLRTDRGSEFGNRRVKELLERRGVEHFLTHNEKKANVAERAIRTIKNRLTRYMDKNQTHDWVPVLERVVSAYNRSYHRSIGMAPEEVTNDERYELWMRFERARWEKEVTNQKFKYKVGDLVRVAFLAKAFRKDYDQQWSSETYSITERKVVEGIVQYAVKTYDNEAVTGYWYQTELQKVEAPADAVYNVERVIRRRRRRGGAEEVLVKWQGWSDRFNSWIPAADLEDI